MTSAMDFTMHVSMSIELRMIQFKIMMDMNMPDNTFKGEERVARDQEYVRRMEEAMRAIEKKQKGGSDSSSYSNASPTMSECRSGTVDVFDHEYESPRYAHDA